MDFWQQLKDKAAIGNSLIDVIIARVKMLATMVQFCIQFVASAIICVYYDDHIVHS